MSVLQEQQNGVNELLKCKMNYLQTQNTWMQKEYDYLCQLVDLQKQIIHSQSQDLSNIHKQIQNVLTQKKQYLHKFKKQQDRKQDLEIDQFIPLIYSFQEKIQKLQNQIKNREASLQTIQLSKGCEELQKKSEIKCINSYQSHSRILDRIKKEISILKQKKCKLQNDLIALNHKNQEESTIFSSKSESNKAVQEHTITNQPNDDQSSVFQKVIMLIKKKRYQNSCLQQKVNRYRQSIERKKIASLHLKKQIEGLQWNCLDGFFGACGFVDSGQVGDLSLVGKSFTNNTSFSFDVSRFIKPTSKRFRISQM